ncbi:hypothetical protein JQ582_34940 [Bradyrhizobium japonicum]|uniref:hypothetical protein n=1 Tax=Bradyrhizobium japonicum TaxID=375 RepID=UPI001BA4D7E4|nr:hypothetical protein [Bradyrhizobium japonicum]MBR0749138.1 hypothetical protein [Bradyrhizobium japonicum]
MLAQTHTKLDSHFKELSRERISLGYPVYAFEHCLDAGQIEDVRNTLTGDFARRGSINRDHWLLWTVVAAETGYAYDGDEYWHSFQSDIPQKFSLANRETIRDWFRTFARQFNGFQPTGRWAAHFSIIAWPITHSILPKYLQSQFARHLFELRHELAARSSASIDQVGELLGNRYHGDSSRFENFLQQTALTARLVLALRDEDVQDKASPIFRPTLARIVRDLEQRGSARGYLRDARRVLREARLRTRPGLSAVPPPRSSMAPGERDTLAPAPGVKLIARRKPDDSWTLGVALPNFPALLDRTGIDAAMLDKSRARFAERPDGWMPGRALLSYSNASHALTALPAPLNEPVIRFRDTDEGIRPLVAHLTIQARPPWLLRVHDDGVARQVLGNHIRAGAEYILAADAEIDPDVAGALSLVEQLSHTSGIKFYHMAVPSVVPPTFIAAAQELSLGYALRAHVQAFGLTPRWDDASGCSVWLANEDILLRLSADFPVVEFSVSVDGGGAMQLPVHGAEGILISLGALELGRHRVVIATTAKPFAQHAASAKSIVPETIFVEVRPPTPWQRDATKRSGLRVVVEPNDASLDDLIEKRAFLTLHGPEGRTASAEAHVYDVAGHISSTSELGRLTLPSQDGAVARLIEKLSREPLSERIQSAPRVALSFVVDEMGAATAAFPHAVAPLRWKLTAKDGLATMRLVDEAGVAAGVTVNRFDMTAPDKRIDVSTESCLHGVAVSSPGSLFVARYDNKIYSAFASVPPKERLATLADLGTKIALASPGENTRGILRLLAMLRYWRRARPHGALAVIRKANVVSLFELQIERLACGAKWIEKTKQCREAGGQLEELQREVGGSPGFASRMRTTQWTWHSDIDKAHSEFFRIAKTYGVCTDRKICDLALRLAFRPVSIRLTDPKEGAHNFEFLGANPVLARGAYFAKMTSDLRFTESQPGSAL